MQISAHKATCAGQKGSSLVIWLGQQSSSSPAGHGQSVFHLYQFVVSRIWAQRLFSMPIPFGRKDTFWHHHRYSQAFTTASLLMFYLFLFELVIKGLTQFIQIAASKSLYGVVAIVIFHSPNESNWILMTVDSIKQHLIGLLPRNFIFIVFSMNVTQKSTAGELSRTPTKLYPCSHFLLFLTSQMSLFYAFIPQDTLNTVSISIEKGGKKLKLFVVYLVIVGDYNSL